MELLELPLRGAHHMGGPGYGMFAMLHGLLLLALLAGIVLLLVKGRLGPVRWSGRPGSPGPHRQNPEDAALDTLRMRLANGDITPEEYLERSSVLRTHQPPPPPGGQP